MDLGRQQDVKTMGIVSENNRYGCGSIVNFEFY